MWIIPITLQLVCPPSTITTTLPSTSGTITATTASLSTHLASLSHLNILNASCNQLLVRILSKQHHHGPKLVTANLISKSSVEAGLGIKLACRKEEGSK